MKTIILTLVGIGLLAQARSETLSTIDGATYNNITSKRTDPDGLYIEYTPAGGGLGMSKIKYARLSSDQQKQFGFDPAKAREYETQVAKANEEWRDENLRREQAGKVERQAREAREDQQEQAATGRIMAMAQLRQAEAQLARSENGGGNYGGSSFDGGYGAVAIPEVSDQYNHRFDGRDSEDRFGRFDQFNRFNGFDRFNGLGFDRFDNFRPFRGQLLPLGGNPLPPIPFNHGRPVNIQNHK